MSSLNYYGVVAFPGDTGAMLVTDAHELELEGGFLDGFDEFVASRAHSERFFDASEVSDMYVVVQVVIPLSRWMLKRIKRPVKSPWRANCYAQRALDLVFSLRRLSWVPPFAFSRPTMQL